MAKKAEADKALERRRRKGEGTIYQRADKKWCAQVSAGRDELGKRKRISIVGDTQEEVIRQKKEIEHALNKGDYVDKNKIKLHDLIRVYLRDFKLNAVSSRTYKWYCDLAKDIIWRMPNKLIQEVTFLDVQNFLNCMARPSKKCNPNGEKLNPLSQKTMTEVYRLLKQVTAFALENHLIAADPCTNKTIMMPDVTKLKLKPQKAIPIDDCQRILEEIDYSPTYKPIINTLFHTGLRVQESIAMNWSDVHFSESASYFNIDKAVTLEYEIDAEGNPGAAKTVRGLPKSDSSIRVVPVDSKLQSIILEWRNIYCQKFKCDYRDKDFGDRLVFPNRYGNLRTYSGFRKQFNRWLEERCLKVNRVTFHQFRHTFATLLIQKGVDARTVQELLGHADVETTLKQYRTVTDDDKRKAVNIVEEVFTTLESFGEVSEIAI